MPALLPTCPPVRQAQPFSRPLLTWLVNLPLTKVTLPKTTPLPQVMQHPWFLEGLPTGAQEMNDYYFANAPTVDSVAPQIARILEAAAAPGFPGEPMRACRFSTPAQHQCQA